MALGVHSHTGREVVGPAYGRLPGFGPEAPGPGSDIDECDPVDRDPALFLGLPERLIAV